MKLGHRRREGQSKGDGRPEAQARRLGANAPVMSRDDLFADRKTKAKPLRTRRASRRNLKKLIEDARLRFVTQADPGVFHFDLHCVWLKSSPDDNPALFGREFKGV